MIYISIILAVLGIIYSIIKERKLPVSISGIAYIIPHWLFSFWIAICGVTLMPALMEYLPELLLFLGFLFVTGLFIVSSTSYYRIEGTIVHYAGALLSSLMALLIIRPIFLLAWIPYTWYILKVKDKKYATLIAECLLYLSLVLTII